MDQHARSNGQTRQTETSHMDKNGRSKGGNIATEARPNGAKYKYPSESQRPRLSNTHRDQNKKKEPEN